MDPITAFGLAANVIALVEISAKLVSATWQISTSGATAEHLEIKTQTQIIHGLLLKLKPGSNADGSDLSEDDKNLVQLCRQSEDISTQLLGILKKCEAKHGGGKVSWDSFWRAIQSEWNDTTIKGLRDRLKTIDEQAHRLISQRYAERSMHAIQGLQRRLEDMGTSRAADMREIQESIRDLSKTKSDASRQEILLNAARKGGDIALQAGILSQLRFEEIDRRIYELDQRPNHERSYIWLDEGRAKKEGQSPSNFTSWLVSRENLYWVSGNPGTGKSTLMKFLYSNPETKAKLEAWAQRRELIVAPYFFWEVGKIALLRTQEGLLRTLLFQVLRQCPKLIGEVYEDLWLLYADGQQSARGSLASFAGSQVSLEVHELRRRMKIVCERMAQPGHACCLFLIVDGSDEYMGKPSEVIALIRDMCQFPHVKICVSSRPENEFRQAYGNLTYKLFMEDFNKADIAAYVQDTLEKHPRFQDDDDRKTLGVKLIKAIVDQSSGVFLWVRLVLEELGDGLTNRDTIFKLQTRLMELPRELGPYFDHILDRVAVRDRPESVSLLMATAEALTLLPPLACWFISEGPDELNAPHGATPTDSRRNIKRRLDIDARLMAYCRGLLVVRDFPLAAKFSSLPSSSVFGQQVIFLHRSVREWLTLPEVQRRLQEWKPPGFDVDEVICKAVLAQVATSPNDAKYFDPDGPVADLLDTFVFHCERLRAEPSRVAQSEAICKDMASVLASQRAVNGHTLDIIDLTQAQGGAAASPLPAAPLPAPPSTTPATTGGQGNGPSRVKGHLRKFLHMK